MSHIEQVKQDTTGIANDTLQPVNEQVFFTEIPEKLREGVPPASNEYREDWITILLFSIFILFAVVATFARHIFIDLSKNVSKGTKGKQTFDAKGIFQWQATLTNLASFISLSLFLYFITIRYNSWFPLNVTGILRWAVLLSSVSVLIALRHLISLATGAISNSIPLFSEYLTAIYILYRTMGIALLPVNIAISLLHNSPVDYLIPAGLIIIGLVLIFRIIRLLNIFLENHISIFYYILYICALEILPGAILFKLITA